MYLIIIFKESSWHICEQSAFVESAEWIKLLESVRKCRDPKDDKFLELAVNGRAEYLVTGDRDLLTLHPFRGTQILTARDFITAIGLR